MGLISTGITIDFSTGFMAEILDVTPPAMSRENVQMSHQGTANWHEFKPAKLADAGECSATIAFLPTEVPPILDDPKTITITFPADTAAGTTWEFEGMLTGYEPSAPFEERMTATVNIKASGAISIDGAEIGAD